MALVDGVRDDAGPLIEEGMLSKVKRVVCRVWELLQAGEEKMNLEESRMCWQEMYEREDYATDKDLELVVLWSIGNPSFVVRFRSTGRVSAGISSRAVLPG